MQVKGKYTLIEINYDEDESAATPAAPSKAPAAAGARAQLSRAADGTMHACALRAPDIAAVHRCQRRAKDERSASGAALLRHRCAARLCRTPRRPTLLRRAHSLQRCRRRSCRGRRRPSSS
jgi:hypothetical protein